MAVVMTPELRAKLEGALPLSCDGYAEFTPKAFANVDELKPIFKIKQFNQAQVLRIRELMKRDTSKSKTAAKDNEKANAEYIQLLSSVLVGWDNWVYHDSGDDVPFTNAPLELIKVIPESILTEMYTFAVKITGFLPHGLL
jgi:hypothetical protein